MLPRGADSNGIVMVKLKRKLMFHGHVYFEPVRPDIVMSALQYLKANTSLYNDISIDYTHRLGANETVSLSNIPQSEEISLAPCEGKQSTSILTDEYCEELSHPHLFPTGKFGYKVERNVKLSPVRYFNQRLLYYTQKFASDADYI